MARFSLTGGLNVSGPVYIGITAWYEKKVKNTTINATRTFDFCNRNDSNVKVHSPMENILGSYLIPCPVLQVADLYLF